MENGLTVTLRITASDGEKSVSEDFSFEVGISVKYIFEWIGKLIGPVIGALGALVYANEIYNILCVKRYRHPKVFKIKPGEMLEDHEIPPLMIMGEEYSHSNKIWKLMKKKLGKNFLSQIQTNEGKVNEEALFTEIKDARNKLEASSKSKYEINNSIKNKIYGSQAIKYHKKQDLRLIVQLIKDKITFIKLNAHKPTKEIFLKIKESWGHLIISNASSKDLSKVFSMNITEFNIVLKSLGLDVHADHYPDKIQRTHTRDASEATTPGIKRSISLYSPVVQVFKVKSADKFDYDLLKEGMEAQIRKKSYLNFKEERITVVSSKLVVRNSCFGKIKHFLKLNMKPFMFNNKDDLGYGLKCKVIDNKLIKFYGLPSYDVAGIMLVFQVRNLKQRILKEYVIEGLSSDLDESIINIVHEKSVVEEKVLQNNEGNKPDELVTSQPQETFRPKSDSPEHQLDETVHEGSETKNIPK